MLLNQLFEAITRTGKGDTAVVGWGRGMGHKGHMMLASSVVTKAKEVGGDPYFVVSRTVGKDDPITPEEKLAIYKKVFPEQGHIFQAASDEIPDLTRVLADLNKQGYKNAVVVVGADQVKAFQYLKNYNGKADKSGNIAFNFDSLNVISRQETNDPSKDQEGPRATPMRQVLNDPNKSEEEQFAVWRDAMSPELSDDEVRDLMMKAKTRMGDFTKPKKKGVAENYATEKQILTRIRQIMYDRKLSGTDSNAGELHRLKQQLKDMRSQQGVSEGFAHEPDEKGLQHDKLTMPANTLVIDTPGDLDWYKLGHDIANLDQADPHEYGQSDSDVVITTASPEEMQKLMKQLDRLGMRYKAVGGTNDQPEIHDEKFKEDAPPGREKQVKSLKKKFDDPGAPYAIAWAQHNKHGKPNKENIETEDQRLDPSCWKGYRKQGTKMKGGTRVNNCVKVGEGWEQVMSDAISKLFEGKNKK